MYFFIPFITSPRALITTGIVVAFIDDIRLISADFKVFIFSQFFGYFYCGVTVSRQQVSFFVFDDDILSVGLYLTIFLYGHVP